MKQIEKVDKYEAEILQVIKTNNLFSIEDIFAFYSGCCKATFYNNKLNELDSLKRAIDDNKTKTKQSLKNKWYKSENPTLQLALYKSICTDEERKAISMNYQELTGKDGKDLNAPMFIFKDISGNPIE